MEARHIAAPTTKGIFPMSRLTCLKNVLNPYFNADNPRHRAHLCSALDLLERGECRLLAPAGFPSQAQQQAMLEPAAEGEAAARTRRQVPGRAGAPAVPASSLYMNMLNIY